MPIVINNRSSSKQTNKQTNKHAAAAAAAPDKTILLKLADGKKLSDKSFEKLRK